MAATTTTLLDRYMTPLLAGNRVACRELILKEASQSLEAVTIYQDVLWPAMERVDKYFRADRINAATEHMATRINRSVADQIQMKLDAVEPNGRRMLISCADGEPEELGAQMCADLFEARGWEIYFMGGGVPNDEILSLVGQLRPDILLVFGTQPGGVPGVRHLIELVRSVGSNPTMNIMVSGGVFNRADGLWKEIEADMFARSAHEAIELAESATPRTPTLKVPGAPKKRRRRRRAPVVAGSEKRK